MNSWVLTCLWLIPAAPFAASLIILGLSKVRRKSAVALAVIGEVTALEGPALHHLENAADDPVLRRILFHGGDLGGEDDHPPESYRRPFHRPNLTVRQGTGFNLQRREHML